MVGVPRSDAVRRQQTGSRGASVSDRQQPHPDHRGSLAQILTGIPTSELEARRERLLRHLEDQELTADDLGCFRHSDTVVVTPDGIDILTSYPRDIESLTIPA